MKLTSITPVLNEEFYIENFILTNSKYVDEMIISDGGSVDNTIKIIQKYINMGFNIRLTHHTQGKAYTNEFNQDKCLNNMIEIAIDTDYFIQLDADEELTNNHTILKQIIELYPNINLFGLPLITFWGDKNHVRVNAENDLHWYPTPKYCIFKNIKEIRFNNPHHSFLSYNGDNIFKYGSKVIELPFIHLHYLKAKENDNRLSDIGGDYKNPKWNLKENIWPENRFGYQGKYDINVINISDMQFNIAESMYKTLIDVINYRAKEIMILNESLKIKENMIGHLETQLNACMEVKNNEIANLQKQLNTGMEVKNNEINNLRKQLEEAVVELKNRQVSMNVLKEKLIKMELNNGSTPTNICLG